MFYNMWNFNTIIHKKGIWTCLLSTSEFTIDWKTNFIRYLCPYVTVHVYHPYTKLIPDKIHGRSVKVTYTFHFLHSWICLTILDVFLCYIANDINQWTHIQVHGNGCHQQTWVSDREILLFFHRVVGIHGGTNCTPPFAVFDLCKTCLIQHPLDT